MAIVAGNVRYDLFRQDQLGAYEVIARPKCRKCNASLSDGWQKCTISSLASEDIIQQILLQFKNHLDKLPDLPCKCPYCGTVLREVSEDEIIL